MDWTLEDNMIDGLFFCATLAGRRSGHLCKQEQKRPTPVRERLRRGHRCSWQGHSRRVGRGWKSRSALQTSRIPSVTRPEYHISVIVLRWTDELLCSEHKWVLGYRCRAFPLDGQVSAEWSGCLGSMARRARDSVAFRQCSAGWMLARMGRLSAGVGRRHPITVRNPSLMAGLMRRVWALPPQREQATSSVQRVMSTFCEVTRGVGGTWVSCPTWLRGMWARSRRVGFHCCGQL